MSKNSNSPSKNSDKKIKKKQSEPSTTASTRSEKELLPQVKNLFGPHAQNAKWLGEEHPSVYETLDDYFQLVEFEYDLACSIIAKTLIRDMIARTASRREKLVQQVAAVTLQDPPDEIARDLRLGSKLTSNQFQTLANAAQKRAGHSASEAWKGDYDSGDRPPFPNHN